MRRHLFRVAGIDDWSWRKGSETYGAIVVDLERREVVDVPSGSLSRMATANWLRGRPEVEVVSRDRCGLFLKARVKGLRRAVRSPTDFISCRISEQAIEGQMGKDV